MEVEWSPNFLTLDINSQTELAFSPDGQILVSSGGPNNMVVRLWDPNTGALLRTLEGHSESVLALAFSPDGKILASCSCDQTVRLWDLNTEASLSLEVLEGPSDNSNTSRESSFNAVLAFSPDGKILASSYIGGSIRLWDPNTGASIRTLEGHSYGVKILAFSPNGDILASVGVLRLSCTDRVIRLWNPNSGALLRILESHPYGCPTLLFSPDGNILASGSCDSVRAWDPYTGALLGVANLDHDQLDGDTMAFSPSGNILASNTIKNSICLLESDTGVLLGILEGHCEAIITLVFSPNEKLLASSSADGTIRLWDLNTKALLGVHESHSREPTALASTPQKNIHPFGKSMDHWGSYVTLEFSPSGKILASTSFDNTVRLWDPNTGFPFQIIQSSLFDEVGTLAFSPDEKVLAFSFNCRKILLWDLNTETSLGTLEGHSDMVATLAFAPDGKILASGSYDKAIRLWDVRTNARLGTLEGQFYKFSKLVFSPDGKILASGSYDKTVQLWDVRTNTPLGTLEGHSADIVTLAFSPNGKILASEYEDQKVRMWDLSTKAPLGTVDGCFDGIRALSCTPDGKVLASSSSVSIIEDILTLQLVKALYMNSPSFGFSISTDNVSFMTRHGKIYITPKASTDNQRLDHLRPELWGARHNWIFYAQHKIISIPRDFWCDDEEFVVYDNVLAWSDERYRVHIMHLDIPMLSESRCLPKPI